MSNSNTPEAHCPWNRGKLTGQKPPLKPKEVWSIRVRLQIEGKLRELALFNLAIDSKLRSRDLVQLKVSDIAIGATIKPRAAIVQSKTGRPVPFELTEPTREALHAWIVERRLRPVDYLFPSRSRRSPSLNAPVRPPGRRLDRQYRAQSV